MNLLNGMKKVMDLSLKIFNILLSRSLSIILNQAMLIHLYDKFIFFFNINNFS